VSNLNVDN